jgi:hypothetical protein
MHGNQDTQNTSIIVEKKLYESGLILINVGFFEKTPLLKMQGLKREEREYLTKS